MMNTEYMIKTGMFDENIFLYCEEVVLGLKMNNAGYKIGLIPNESFIHNHSVSINKTYSSLRKKRELLLNSKIYVLKKYYNIHGIALAYAYLLKIISIVEITIIEIIKTYINNYYFFYERNRL